MVAAGADQGELGLGHARLDRGDAHPGAMQVRTQAQGELAHKGLGAAVGIAARIGIGRRHRADVQDGPLAFDQTRQHPVRQGDQASDIGVDHLTPLAEVSLLRRGGAQSQTGIVQQDIDGGKLRRQAGQGRIDCRLVAHVKGQGMDPVGPQFSHQGVQTLGPAAGGDHLPARADKATRRGLADACRCPGDQNGAAHEPSRP